MNDSRAPCGMKTPGWLSWTLAAVAVLAILSAPEARAGGAASAFILTVRALTDFEGTELTVTVTPDTAELAAPAELKHVQIKMLGLDGSLERVLNLDALALTEGRATLDLPQLSRGQGVEAQV